jgi:hypothetical protein
MEKFSMFYKKYNEEPTEDNVKNACKDLIDKMTLDEVKEIFSCVSNFGFIIIDFGNTGQREPHEADSKSYTVKVNKTHEYLPPINPKGDDALIRTAIENPECVVVYEDKAHEQELIERAKELYNELPVHIRVIHKIQAKDFELKTSPTVPLFGFRDENVYLTSNRAIRSLKQKNVWKNIKE